MFDQEDDHASGQCRQALQRAGRVHEQTTRSM